MAKAQEGRRSLKRRVKALLDGDDFLERLPELRKWPARQVVNPLISFLCNNEKAKMRSVTAIGFVVAHLAEEDTESARVIMRRLMWHLNDESGGIGWGCPEAMGEIMARHEGLAEEYGSILVSFIREDGNFLELSSLLAGALWGIGRVAHARPHALPAVTPHVLPYLRSENPRLRGLAVWVLEALQEPASRSELEPLLDDASEVAIYEQGRWQRCRVSELAERALSSTA